MESASAGTPPGETGPVGRGGANAVSRWGSSGHSLGCAVGTNEDILSSITTEKAFTCAQN